MQTILGRAEPPKDNDLGFRPDRPLPDIGEASYNITHPKKDAPTEGTCLDSCFSFSNVSDEPRKPIMKADKGFIGIKEGTIKELQGESDHLPLCFEAECWKDLEGMKS